MDVPVSYTRRDYDIEIFGSCDLLVHLNEIRELFAKCLAGSAIHDDIPGERPIGEDLTEDNQNTEFLEWTHGDKPITGWYLLRGTQTFEDDSPVGFAYNFTLSLFYIGSTSYYQAGYAMKGLELATNDWGI